MTKDQLDAIRARVDMATPGEWRIEYGGRGWTVWAKSTVTGSMCLARVGYADFDGRNAEFIAKAREDVPALLAEVERLRDALAMVAAPLSPTAPDLWIGVQLARNVLGDKT